MSLLDGQGGQPGRSRPDTAQEPARRPLPFSPLPQRWPWTLREGEHLPPMVTNLLSKPELAGEALGGQAHWTTMMPTVGGGALGLLITLALVVRSPLAALVTLATTATIVGVRWWLWQNELVFITGKRVIATTGLLVRGTAMMPLSKLTDLNYMRTPAGQLFGYGTMRLESAGQNQALEKLARLPDPDYTYRWIQDLLFGKPTQHVRITGIDLPPEQLADLSGLLGGLTIDNDVTTEGDDDA